MHEALPVPAGACCPVRIQRPYAHTYTFRVKPADAGKSLLSFLLERFPFRDETGWRLRIADGRVQLNQFPADPTQLLCTGDIIQHTNLHVTEPSVPDSVRIVAESPDYLLVEKPAPMPVHPGGRYNRNCLTEILKENGNTELHLIHRLDAVTSGLMLLGKNPDFSREASALFRSGDVEKMYYARVKGLPDWEETSCDQPIGREKGFRFACLPEGKPARSVFRVMTRGTANSIVACEPVTGRTHQLRLHLAWLGYPITDDLVYQPGNAHRLQNRAICLHSAHLRIPALAVDASLPVPSEWHEEL